ncbi:hypothetical protein NA57DRAFT_69831 [Rhizodiscina lignyota]|uniref:GST N-terminal domain-containing protein n=1 Tax=Rhizodiscina lignyota TaxID=1504668 RepID=A0A9P4I433_9PEZI|nr:hypothetical protein NA57DRAFT_69831 [Rhizodiscina lignyota]
MANNQVTVYSSTASQWAGVPLLGLAEKDMKEDEYKIEEIDLFGGENFHPDYVKINPNGTIPSLTTKSLPKPLVDSTEILNYLDQRLAGTSLTPIDTRTREVMQRLIGLVHSDQMGTNLILLHARNKEEMEKKQSSMWNEFLRNRQAKLEKYGGENPELDAFYKPRIRMNGAVNKLYNSPVGEDHQTFFTQSDAMFRDFAAGLQQLDSLLVLPYAAGDELTLADLHIIPWLSHAMWGAGGSQVTDFEPLEKLLQISDHGFTIGAKIKLWWSKVGERESFKKCFPVLH